MLNLCSVKAFESENTNYASMEKLIFPIIIILFLLKNARYAAALCSMFPLQHYAQNYSGIMYQTLLPVCYLAVYNMNATKELQQKQSTSYETRDFQQ